MLRAWREWREQRAAARLVIHEEQWWSAEYALPFLDRLTDTERQQLRALARRFIATKEWSGAHDLRLTPAIQLSIALQACLPILKLGLDWYRGWVGIIVYPGDFVIPRRIQDEDGITHEFDDAVLGEAWEDGPVLLSWFDDPDAVGDVNIVIHEFAHKLDMTNGGIDGMPALPAHMRASDWIQAFQPAYEDFRRRARIAALRGVDTPIDPYAAEHCSEFFAVTSEVFFEAPDLLLDEYPFVYRQLSMFYRQDPLQVVAMQQK